MVGYGPNFLTALQIGTRFVLHNGSHRAYALRELGVTHVPCLVQGVSREDELELAGVPDVKTFPDSYLKCPRPALLKDYFDSRLRKIMPVVRKHRLRQVQVGWQEGKVPAT
jgi:ParB-like chromosome segregation protein Spo0J